MKLQFLGAAGTVTGSRFLLTREEGGRPRRTLVDCGLFQGLKENRLRNWAAFPVPPRSIDEVILTHAHIDHGGALPLLVKQGFAGPIHCSRPTRDLLRVLLRDSARLQEEDAEFANRRGFSKHHPALPLYTVEDADRALERLEPVDNETWHPLGRAGKYRLSPSSHILGSAFIEIEAGGTHLVFSGDVGRSSSLLFPPRAILPEADVLVVESTYGGRLHPVASPIEELARIVDTAFRAGGRVIIPCFAVGRTQEVIYLLSRLRAQGRLPSQPVYLDSPMGIEATRIFYKYPGWHRLTESEIREMEALVTPLPSRDESIRAMRSDGPAIVIAGSGMMTGGRVLHHVEHRLGDANSTILLTGFQAEGTRGRLLQDGAVELKLHGRWIAARAKVETLEGLSAHADQAELLAWLEGFRRPPRRTFIVHGEPASSAALARAIAERLGWKCEVPAQLEEFSVGD